jgi:hypothetical protein
MDGKEEEKEGGKERKEERVGGIPSFPSISSFPYD